uniref:Conserved oligomeric Golgi complex subunit 8 n=1 Tax=Chlamydomonas euryale TaxID=1486919 RepID=A0A7R9V6L7_9CHLO
MAVFTNAVLSALNELRHCALSSLARPAACVLSQAAEAVAGSMLHYIHTRSLQEGERSLFRSAAKAANDVVLPYLSTCFARVFSGGLARVDTAGAAALLSQALQEA